MSEIPPPVPPAPYSAPIPGGPAQPSKGLAITSMILGIVSIVACCYWFLGVPLGIAAVVLGILALKQRQPRGFAVTGLITGGVGLLAGAGFAILAASGAVFDNYCNDNPDNVFCEQYNEERAR